MNGQVSGKQKVNRFSSLAVRTTRVYFTPPCSRNSKSSLKVKIISIPDKYMFAEDLF